MGIIEYFIAIFIGLTIVCLTGFVASPNKRFLKILENEEGVSAEAMMIWGVIPIGTMFLGSKPLNLEQLRFYELEPPEEIKQLYMHHSGNVKDMSISERKYLPKFRTKFLTFFIPLIPIRTQIIFNEEKRGIIFREGKFNVIPVEMYWKQAFFILSFSYGSLLILIMILTLLL